MRQGGQIPKSIHKVKMAKDKFNEHGELIEVTEEHKKLGITYEGGRRLLHGFNSEEMDEMNELSLGHEDMRKLLAERKSAKKSKKK